MLQKFSFEFKQGQGDYKLLPVEFLPEQIPFEVKRTYFILGGESRTQTGQHAHFQEREVFLVIQGEAELISLDSDQKPYTLLLKQGEAIYIPNLVWHGFKNIQSGSIICAYSSTHHNPDRSDYLEDITKFLKMQNS